MFFWFREIIGWALLALSLYIINTAINFVEARQVFEAGVTLSAALIVMRCGTLLIRLSTVARITLLDDRARNAPEKRR